MKTFVERGTHEKESYRKAAVHLHHWLCSVQGLPTSSGYDEEAAEELARGFQEKDFNAHCCEHHTRKSK